MAARTTRLAASPALLAHAVPDPAAAAPLTDVLSQLEEQGFAAVADLAEREELAEIRTLLEQLFHTRAGAAEGAQFDILSSELSAEEKLEAGRLRQISTPSNYAPRLRSFPCIRKAHQLARSILGDEARLAGDLVIMKPAHAGAGTPWHQDEAFRDPHYEYHEITIWIPLQDVAAENGCLWFVPGSHRAEVLPHHSPNDDARAHGLECIGPFRAESAVACPLSAGDCSIHAGRTLHKAGANTSDEPRYAYILVFATPPKPRAAAEAFPWLEARHPVDIDKRRTWLRRGGFAVIAWRKMRYGKLWSPAGLRYAAQRGMDLLRGRA